MKLLSFAWICLGWSVVATGTQQRFEFPSETNKEILIENNFGEVIVAGNDSSKISIVALSLLPQSAAPEDLPLVVREQGGRVQVAARPSVPAVWPIQLRVYVPVQTDATIWGLAPSVTIANLEGALRVRTDSGPIRISDSHGGAVVTSISGPIDYSLEGQLRGDVFLVAERGIIHCTLPAPVNLEAILLGDSISWKNDTLTSRGRLQRRLGRGGPLLFASARGGQVDVSIQESRDLPLSAANGTEVFDPPPTFKVEANWVFMNVSVTDPLRNAGVQDLAQTDFLVYENDIRQSIGHFQLTEAPFHLVLLLDMSESVRPHLSLIRRAALEFAGQLRTEDQLAIASFNDRVELIQDFTNSPDLISKAIKGTSSAGGTAVYDALHAALTHFLAGVEGRKAIVLFSDGVDNSLFDRTGYGSGHAFEQVLELARESTATIFPIYLDPGPQQQARTTSATISDPASVLRRLARVTSPYSSQLCTSENDPSQLVPCPSDLGDIFVRAEKHMRMLADETGGRLYMPARLEDLGRAYSQVASDLRSQYTLGYLTKAEPDGRWRSLKVRVRGGRPLVVRTRAGFYARRVQ